MTDTETAAAIEALTHRFKTRDQAIRDGEDHPDAEVTALEFMTALRSRGWRPTAAKVFPVPRPATPGSVPSLKPETADLLRDLHADMDARAAAAKAAKEGAA